jgi:hypothetical protein
MFDRSLKVRRLVALGTAVAATAIAAPLAAADPAPLFITHTQTAQPRLGEHLNGSDRTWLSMRERTPRLGEGWSGSDRSWRASGPPRPPRCCSSLRAAPLRFAGDPRRRVELLG